MDKYVRINSRSIKRGTNAECKELGFDVKAMIVNDLYIT